MAVRGREASRRTMKVFPREVTDAVLEALKVPGIRAKMLDGGHVFLYGPNGSTLKVSRSRPAKDSVNYVRGFVANIDMKEMAR
jgi:hypothetical protein